MHKRFGVRPSGLVPKNNVIEVIEFLGMRYSFPELMKTPAVAQEGKWLNIGIVWTAPVPIMFVFAHSSCYYFLI
jgi:hypothetical protein